MITNDGVTIAKEIELEDHFENMGAKLIIKWLLRPMISQVTVLTQAIVNEGIKNITGANPIGIRRGIGTAVATAVEALKNNAIPVSRSKGLVLK